MCLDGQFIRSGLYKVNSGGDDIFVYGMVQHSETGAFYILAGKKDDWQMIPLDHFLGRNSDNTAPAYTLIKFVNLIMTPANSCTTPGLYCHFKGKTYTVYGSAVGFDGGIMYVIYRPTYGQQALLARPLTMFFENVQRDSYNGPRFWRVGDVPSE